MMDDDKLKVLKTEITSILASTSSPLSVSLFIKEYRDVIGRNFPWAQFGFRNPTEFLKSMPDILTFRNNEFGEVLVPTENNSAHITKLVQEQKKNSKKGFIRRPRPVQLPRDDPKSDLKPLITSYVPNHLAVRGWERRQPVNPYINTPAYNHVAPNFSFAASQYSQFSQNLWNINQIPQSLFVNTYSTVQTEFTSTKLPLVPKKTSLSEMQNTDKHSVPGGYFGGADQSSAVALTNGINDDVGKEETSPNKHQVKNSSPENQNLVEADNAEVLRSEVSLSLNDFEGEEEDSCPISEKMKENFRKILSKHRGGLLVSKLASAYVKMFNITLNCQDYGFPTIKDLVMSCHDVFKIQHKKHAKDWLLFDVNNESDDSSRWIPSQVLENMQELSLAYPNGILNENVLKLYKNMFKVDLDIAKLGFDSLTSFLVNCQSIECCTVDDQYVVFPMKWGRKDKELEESNTDPFLSVDTYSIFSKKHFEDDVCGFQFCYKKFTVSIETVLNVLVADCISPDYIWLQTLDSATLLNELMFELNTFYDEEEEHYIMDEEFICPRLACCVKFNNKQWHRALIEEVYSNSVKVTFVDYGTSSVVSFKDLRTLHKKFSEASVHSFRSRLHNIKPINNKSWTEECLEFFYFSIYDNVFMAEIVEINDEVASVMLVDTRESEDNVINFLLVDKHFALHVTDSGITDTFKNNISEKEIGAIPKKIEKTYPDDFLKLLPYWLHCGHNWNDVTKMFEKASREFSNGSGGDNSTALHNYLSSTQCVQNKVLSLFMKKPKVICDAWNKTFYSLIDEFEIRFLKNIEEEFSRHGSLVENATNHKNHKFSNYESSSNLKNYLDKLQINSQKFDEPVSINCSEKNSCQIENTEKIHSPYERPVSKKDYYDRSYSSNSSTRDVASPIHCSKECKDPKVLPANVYNAVINLIRYDSEIYVLMDELLSKFAKSVPSILVNHRLNQHHRNFVPFVVTPEQKVLYNGLRRQGIGLKNNAVSLIPLSSSSSLLLTVEPNNRRVAKVLSELADECYNSKEFWTT